MRDEPRPDQTSTGSIGSTLPNGCPVNRSMRSVLGKPSEPLRLEIRPHVWLDSRLALWLADEGVLVIADLHWGFATSHRVQGNLLPAWGDEQIATRVCALVADYRPREMIWLGDSLHTLAGSRVAEDFLRQDLCPVTIISGNHDAKWSRAKDRTSAVRGHYFFHHGDRAREVPPSSTELVGHYHPAVSWADGGGTRLKLPALIESRSRLVLPAFSPWAGGVPWRNPADGETVYAIGSKRIFTVPRASHHKEHSAK
jgi:metallophosphoesterase superfamily enzyme